MGSPFLFVFAGDDEDLFNDIVVPVFYVFLVDSVFDLYPGRFYRVRIF